ncbi:transcriptional regulatory protein [Gardnerella pickettii JCP7659]|uniref:Transcriptional regulatory protein n=2 Tax=Bifidobacteriaceae TaxID=31953 RepID=T2PKY1_9BIFI|nr:transcriptional regulatory protein [Gardnerella pickettii JCP8017A]EPI54736.1 transcriptional regulatory protein [Gardnerella pickettii JCP7659]EPI61778.1 transcriptional regulatory protein [Gardnerella pickettii JCP8017B]
MRYGGVNMTDITLMTSCAAPAKVLPSLTLLSHRVRVVPMEPSSMLKMPEDTILLVDAREDLSLAKSLCSLVRASNLTMSIILILTEGGFTVVNPSWGVNDVMLTTASPAEVEGRLRLAAKKVVSADSAAGSTVADSTSVEVNSNGQMCSGDLVVDTQSYTVSLHGKPIDLAYKEFELLKYFVQHPRRVFTRAHLLQEVWGYDYYGGTRTVDVHIRRLRAKLGVEYEHVIGTVRNVGYRFDPLEAQVDEVENDDYAQNGNSADAVDSRAEDSGVSNDLD